MSANKRPSTSSLRRFITSRPYVTIAELRRRFGLDEPDGIGHVERNGTHAWIGLPEREALKLQDLWQRDEIGLELSVEVHAPVVVGIYPMRIARYVMDPFVPGASNGHVQRHGGNGDRQPGPPNVNGRLDSAPRPLPGASYPPPMGAPKPASAE